MRDIIIYGYSLEGTHLAYVLQKCIEYNFVGFADNDTTMQELYVKGNPIMGIKEVADLSAKNKSLSVVIASKSWYDISIQLNEYGIPIEAIYLNGKYVRYNLLKFSDVIKNKTILYAGDISEDDEVNMINPYVYGLSITHFDNKHILHDITKKFPIPDNSVDGFISEHVFEHIEYEALSEVINEIYRILKVGAILRICLPDYHSIQRQCTLCDADGNLIYDANGGGSFNNRYVVDHGHMWFPTYYNVLELINKTKFKKVDFISYRTQDGRLIAKNFDSKMLHLVREEKDYPSSDTISIIVDLQK